MAVQGSYSSRGFLIVLWKGDTKVRKIEASLGNGCAFCGAFTSGLAILAHVSQLEAQFQNLRCSFSKNDFLFVLNMIFVPYPTVVLILNLEASEYMVKW